VVQTARLHEAEHHHARKVWEIEQSKKKVKTQQKRMTDRDEAKKAALLDPSAADSRPLGKHTKRGESEGNRGHGGQAVTSSGGDEGTDDGVTKVDVDGLGVDALLQVQLRAQHHVAAAQKTVTSKRKKIAKLTRDAEAAEEKLASQVQALAQINTRLAELRGDIPAATAAAGPTHEGRDQTMIAPKSIEVQEASTEEEILEDCFNWIGYGGPIADRLRDHFDPEIDASQPEFSAFGSAAALCKAAIETMERELRELRSPESWGLRQPTRSVRPSRSSRASRRSTRRAGKRCARTVVLTWV